MSTRLHNTLATVTLLSLSALVILPAAVRAGQNALAARQAATLSNAKQLGIGLLMYAQDYDEIYAPAATPPGTIKGSPALDAINSSGWAAVLMPYVKNLSLLRSPGIERGKYPVQFMYNDLISRVSLPSITQPAQTVLLMDGEDVPFNAGHAWTKDAAPVGATPETRTLRMREGKKTVTKTLFGIAPGKGATVKTAPIRFNGGGIYTFADGHAKWLKPDSVVFPPRASQAPERQKSEPARPATFRLR